MMSNVGAADDERTSLWSAYANQMKEAMASFSERLEDAYQKANARQRGAANDGAGSRRPSDDGGERDTTPKDLFKPGIAWAVDSYKQANPMARLTVGTLVQFMLLCIIVILATVGTSPRSSPPPPSDVGAPSSSGSGGDGGRFDVDAPPPSSFGDGGGPDARTDDGRDPNAELSNGGDDPSDSIGGAASAPSLTVFVLNTTEPTPAPSYDPTFLPTAGPVETMPGSPKGLSCLDGDGKFRNTSGKSKECRWLTKDGRDSAGDPLLRSDRLDAECGVLARSAELGLNCRRACRAYNGCLLLPGAGGGSSRGRGPFRPRGFWRARRRVCRRRGTRSRRSPRRSLR